jgi:hypothetical protein
VLRISYRNKDFRPGHRLELRLDEMRGAMQ